MKSIRVVLFSLLILCCTMCIGCYHVAGLIMSMPEKGKTNKWKTEKYKVSTQSRQDWSGPKYYRVKVKKKKLGGVFYSKLVSQNIWGYDYQQCVFSLPTRKDSVRVDVCHKKVVEHK